MKPLRIGWNSVQIGKMGNHTRTMGCLGAIERKPMASADSSWPDCHCKAFKWQYVLNSTTVQSCMEPEMIDSRIAWSISHKKSPASRRGGAGAWWYRASFYAMCVPLEVCEDEMTGSALHKCRHKERSQFSPSHCLQACLPKLTP